MRRMPCWVSFYPFGFFFFLNSAPLSLTLLRSLLCLVCLCPHQIMHIPKPEKEPFFLFNFHLGFFKTYLLTLPLNLSSLKISHFTHYVHTSRNLAIWKFHINRQPQWFIFASMEMIRLSIYLIFMRIDKMGWNSSIMAVSKNKIRQIVSRVKWG